MAILGRMENEKEPQTTRERVLAAAKSLFASRGYENTSTVAVARAARTSESQLFKHFGSKEGLLAEIFESGWGKVHELLAGQRLAGSPRERLRTVLGVVLATMKQDPQLKQLLLLEGRRVRKEGQLVMLTGGFMRLVGLLDSLLEEMRSASELRPDLPVEVVRSALMGMVEGLLRDELLAHTAPYPAHFGLPEIQRFFDTVLGALGTGEQEHPC